MDILKESDKLLTGRPVIQESREREFLHATGSRVMNSRRGRYDVSIDRSDRSESSPRGFWAVTKSLRRVAHLHFHVAIIGSGPEFAGA